MMLTLSFRPVCALRSAFLVSALAAALASGCETTSSRDLRTSGIDAEITVSASSSTASNVHVRLLPGGDDDPFNIVKLEGGDALFVESGGQRKRMASQTTSYETSFAIVASATPFRAILDRARADDIDAPDSVGQLPAAFEIGSLGSGERSRAQELVVTWSTSGTPEKITLETQGSCVDNRSISVAGDPGTYTFSPGTLRQSPDSSSCQATITIHRTRSGVVDTNLNSESSFTLEQV